MKTLELKRDHYIIKSLCEQGTVIKGTATLKEVSMKKGYQNALLTDIRFEYLNNEILIDHCWLQQCDYPKIMKKILGMTQENSRLTIEFKFYPYRDAVDRGMHGMTLTRLIILPPKKNK